MHNALKPIRPESEGSVFKCPHCGSIFPPCAPQTAIIHEAKGDRIVFICPHCNSCFDIPNNVIISPPSQKKDEYICTVTLDEYGNIQASCKQKKVET